MKSIVVFGGTGGLGSQLCSYLKLHTDYHIFPVGSRNVDICSYEACRKFFDRTIADVVINLSGINFDKFVHKLDRSNDEDISRMLDINLHGSINIASTCLPVMRERGYGRLIYISSILSTQEVLGTSIYSSCKAFLDKFVKGVSKENIGKGVTCNSIQLGYFDGGMTYKVPNSEPIKQSIGLKRWGSIEELAKTILYIINTEYLTGTNIPLNGGL